MSVISSFPRIVCMEHIFVIHSVSHYLSWTSASIFGRRWSTLASGAHTRFLIEQSLNSILEVLDHSQM
jgi:hypothetical protein